MHDKHNVKLDIACKSYLFIVYSCILFLMTKGFYTCFKTVSEKPKDFALAICHGLLIFVTRLCLRWICLLRLTVTFVPDVATSSVLRQSSSSSDFSNGSEESVSMTTGADVSTLTALGEIFEDSEKRCLLVVCLVVFCHIIAP